MDDVIQTLNPIDLRHLRRFVQPDRLPPRVRNLKKDSVSQDSSSSPNDKVRLVGSLAPGSTGEVDIEPTLHFLICATSTLSHEELRQILLSSPPFFGSKLDPRLCVITVPLFAPTSETQAKQLSEDYWPTAYKGGNPFGPHPTIILRATDQIEGQVEQYMGLASRVGILALAKGIGLSIGAVVVDRTRAKGATITAVAGDARWQGAPDQTQHGGTNVMAHSVMRVIGMVARRRRSLLVGQEPRSHMADPAESFADEPLTSIENEIYANSDVAEDGYLCSNLELYVTHEPCVMCCMAINHSRFGRVIFGERMLTGGLQTEKRDGDSSTANYGTYGIWWRQELNWKFLTWNWASEGDSPTAADLRNIHA